MSKKKEHLNNAGNEKKKPGVEPTKEQTGGQADKSEQAPHAMTGEQQQIDPDETVKVEEGEPETPDEAAAATLSAEGIAKLIKEKEEFYDRLLRTQADFDNYRKRAQRETANLLKYGAEDALREILPVMDNLARALDSARKHTESNSQLLQGLELILAQFINVLEKLGLKPVETVGHQFDPNKHDALLRVHAPDAPEGAVVNEIRKGYYYHDKVLRPAQVTVGTQEGPKLSDQKSEEKLQDG